MANIFLTGVRTTLRPVSVDDIPLLTTWMNDEETRKYLLRRFPLTEIEEKTWVQNLGNSSRTPTDITLVIETKNEGKPIGTMGLHRINWVDRNAVTGTVTGNVEFRGKGYASDAKMTLLKYAFETLGMHKIISHAFAENVASITYSKRCGYVVEATLKEEVFREGEWRDVISLACFYPIWKEVYEKK